MPTARRSTADYIADESFLDEEFAEDSENVSSLRSSAIQSGWEAALKAAQSPQSSGGYINDFRFSEDSQLVKFLDSEPLAVYSQHWIERAGKRSWTCLGNEKCPLCSIGDKPSRKVAFAIANLSSPDGAVAEVLTVSPKTMQILNRYHQDRSTGPLDRLYYSMSKTGSGPKTVFNILPVKARDLEEDWGLDPAETEAVIGGFEPLSSKVISFHTAEQLDEIAREITQRAPRG
jgi:hypothetical protein